MMQKHSFPITFSKGSFNGSARSYSRERMNITGGGTIEFSQSDLGDGQYLTIEDYRNFGTSAVQAIHEYLSGNDSEVHPFQRRIHSRGAKQR